MTLYRVLKLCCIGETGSYDRAYWNCRTWQRRSTQLNAQLHKLYVA